VSPSSVEEEEDPLPDRISPEDLEEDLRAQHGILTYTYANGVPIPQVLLEWAQTQVEEGTKEDRVAMQQMVQSCTILPSMVNSQTY